MVPNIKANKLVGIAVVSPKRIPLLPDVPTMAESGYPGVTMGQWFGIVGPANMPKEATDLLNKNINEILQLPEVQKVLAAKGAEAGGGSPADFAKPTREDRKSTRLNSSH